MTPIHVILGNTERMLGAISPFLSPIFKNETPSGMIKELLPMKQRSCAPPPMKIGQAVSGTVELFRRVHLQEEEEEEEVAERDGGDSVAVAFRDYQSLFVSQRAEAADPIALAVVEGAMPLDFPAGTYYLAGPGMFSDDQGSTVHPLDGHGYLRAFEFGGAGGRVRYRARYVVTEARAEEWEAETGKWRFTHRGPFSVLKGGRRLGNTKVMKNVANTSVLRWGSHLLCLWEGGFPYEIDPSTLDTMGPFNIVGEEDEPPVAVGGASLAVAAARSCLKPILHGVFKMPPKRLLSHYKIDAHRKRLLLISCNAEDMLLPFSNFTFYEYDLSLKLLQKKEFSIPDHLMIHDWAFTDSHYIIFGNRIKLDIAGAMLAVSGSSPMISALSVNPSKPASPIYLLPRFTSTCRSGRDWRVPVEAPSQLWLLHVGNSFEQIVDGGDLEIQIYAAACSYEWFNFQKMFGYDWQTGKLDPTFMNARESLLPHLIRVSIELNVDGYCMKCHVEPLNKWKRPSDFPAINPVFSGRRNTFVYASASLGCHRFLPHFPFDSVAKINIVDGSVSIWSTRNRRFVGEPVFVPKGDEEDDGYLLVIEYAVSVKRCYLVILDPRRIGKQDAVVAKLEVPKHLSFPLGFHGFWAAQ